MNNRRTYTYLVVIAMVLLGLQLMAEQAWAITRDQVITNAEQYASYRWQVKAGNASSKYNYFKVGQTVTGVAYNWGGTDTISQFESKIKAGRVAGNVYSKNGIQPSFGGLDCSAFVNRVWGWPGRYTTATLNKIASNIAWTQLKAGDALNIASSHVRLFHYFTSGTNYVMVYESTPGHVMHRVVSRGSYKPMRYNQIEDGTPPPVLQAPTITGVSPNPLKTLPIDQRQWLTIYGRNFTSSSRLEFKIVGGATYPNRVPVYVSSTELRYNISVGFNVHDWTVTAINGGKVSNSYRFQVRNATAPKPVITGVSPNPMQTLPDGERQSITITGSNFRAGALLLFKIVDAPGYTYPDRVPVSVTSTKITYNINVGSTPYNWNVQVINPDGQASNAYAFKTVNSLPVVKKYTVTVAKAGTGSGAVTGTGINCGADCTETYDVGSVLDLKVTPAAGSEFVGWELNGTPVNGAITVSSQNSTLTAVFEIIPIVTPTPTPTPAPNTKPLYRLFVGRTDGGWTNHMDSLSTNESGFACQRRLGQVLETQISGTKPIYQVWRHHDVSGKDIKDDHLTTDTLTEVVSGSTNGGIFGYIYTTQVPGTIPLYRKYRQYWYTIYGGENLLHTDHITTTDQAEGNSEGWIYERVLGYIMQPATTSCP